MSIDITAKDLTTKLVSISQLVNEWLKFSEAKNAVFIAFSGAGVTVIVTYLSAASNIPRFIYTGCLIAILFFCLSSLLCAMSFLPKTNLEHIIWLRSKPSKKNKIVLKDTDNFYYFGDLKKYHSNELLASINRLYFEAKINCPYRKEDLDIANQIIVNSEIISIKLKLFTIALWILFFSIVSIPIALLASIFIQ